MANNVGNVIAYIELRLELLQQGIKKAVSSIQTMGKTITAGSKYDAKAMAKEWQAGFALLSVAVLKATRVVNSAFGDMVGTFADFEQSLANTQSVAQANTEELLAMEEAARRVGATTRSTASEAANALYYLASAGFSAAEAIAALDGVNALAIATNSDLAKTSETVATTIRQYGLETSAATDIANTFTAAITNSLATMDKLAKSFEYVGPIAAGLGLSVEETTGALQVLYNKGFSGEKAGRGLRTILVNLADSTSVVVKRLERLGITFDEINPTTNSLADIFDTLRENEVDATNAAAIFGKVSGVQLASLVAEASNAKGGIVELTAAVTGTNRAFEAMEIQMDTLKGSIDKFKNAEEALKITTGKELEPVLRSIVDTGTGMVKMLNSLNPKALAAGAAISVLAINSVALAFAIKAAAVLLAKMGVTAALAIPGLGQLIAIIAGVTAVTIGMIAAAKKAERINFEKAQAEFGDLAEATDVAKEELKDFYKSAREAADSIGFISPEYIQTTDDLRGALQRLQDNYGLTAAQALELWKANDRLAEGTKDLIAQVEEEIAIETEFNRKRDEFAIAELERRARSNAAYDESKARIKAEEAAEENRIRSTAEAYQSLELAFQRAVEQQKAYGDEFNRNETLTDAFKKSLDSLIEQGLKYESVEVQKLITNYKELQELYGVVGKLGKSDAQIQAEVMATLNKSLKEINELETFNLKNGIAYNAEKERSTAVVKAFSTAIANDFTMTGGFLTRLDKDFGNLIISTDSATNSAQEYIDKLNAIGATELRLNEIARDAAIAKAGSDKDKIDAINAYHNALRNGLVVARDSKRADQVTEYEEKLKDLTRTEIELIEVERAKALVIVKGNTKATIAVNKFFDALVKIEKVEQFKENIAVALDYVTTAFDAFDAFAQASFDKKIAMEEELLEAKLKAIDDAETAALISAGVLEETTIERLQRELAEVIGTGDAIAIAEAEDAIARQTIKDEYNAQRIAAEEETAQAIAELEYKAAMASWLAQLAQAARSSYLAILKAYEQLGPLGGIAGASIVGALSAIQIGALIAAKPQAPKFADGGVVPGSSYKGDVTPILANAGELILNKAQQDNVAGQMGNDKPINITINSVLDGKVVATNSAKYYRNGTVKL